MSMPRCNRVFFIGTTIRSGMPTLFWSDEKTVWRDGRFIQFSMNFEIEGGIKVGDRIVVGPHDWDEFEVKLVFDKDTSLGLGKILAVDLITNTTTHNLPGSAEHCLNFVIHGIFEALTKSADS
jgi:hypothetical protein